MNTKKFWQKAAERAVKTAAQSALLVIGADQVNALSASWADVGGFALGGLVLSLLTSVATSGAGPDDDPSAV
jgi:r1t holin